MSKVGVQGLEYTTMFCGDGINDLAALSAADVGMAIGNDTDANIAAAILSTRPSVSGQHRCVHTSCMHIWSALRQPGFLRQTVALQHATCRMYRNGAEETP